jgi:LPS O-antigen subunit length determinant protein (WzzB/FepE family)
MKNKNPINKLNEEIDLIELLKIIWNGKIKILLITIISFIVGLGYNSQIPTNYSHSLTINASKTAELIRLDIHKFKFLKSNRSNRSNQSNQSDLLNLSNKSYLDRFINELADYEEFLLSVKNTKKIQENFSKLKIEDQEIELFKYAKLLEIVWQKKSKNYKINFKWHNIDEAKDVLQDTINFTLINLEKSIYKELNLTNEEIYDFNHLDYLKTQRWIAKELNISDIPYGYTGKPYYLRGYVAIDKEIENFKNIMDKKLKFLKTKINSSKKANMKWIKYNISLIEEKSLKNTKLILMISILSGLIGGVFFVLISNAFQSQTASKKTR